MPEKQWEYHRLVIKDDEIEGSQYRLAELGRQGWEMCGIGNTKDSIVCFFKRLKK